MKGEPRGDYKGKERQRERDRTQCPVSLTWTVRGLQSGRNTETTNFYVKIGFDK